MSNFEEFRKKLEAGKLKGQRWTYRDTYLDINGDGFEERITRLTTSADTRTTLKIERAIFPFALDRAALLIREIPDITSSQIEAAEPETRKLGDNWMEKLFNEAVDPDHHFSSLGFCTKFWASKAGLTEETTRNYYSTESHQRKQDRRGRPVPKKE